MFEILNIMIRFENLNHLPMKSYSTIFKVILTGFIVLLLSCSKETPDPQPISYVKTIGALAITPTSFGSVGEIAYVSPVSARGVCWSTHQNVTTSDNKISDGTTGSSLFLCNVTGLTPGATYYFRSYAIISNTTFYGAELLLSLPLK